MKSWKKSPALKKVLDSGAIQFDLSDDQDFEDLLQLNAIGWEMKDIYPDSPSFALLDLPVTAHGVQFWKPTVAVLMWHRDVVMRFVRDDDLLGDTILLYALAHRKTFEKIAEMPIEKVRKKAIRWSRKVKNINMEQLALLFDQLFGSNDENGEKDGGGNADSEYCTLINHLTREIGGSQDSYLYHTSIEKLDSIVRQLSVDAIAQQRDADNQARKNGTAVPVNSSDPAVIAINKFRNLVAQIEARKAREGTEDDG